MMRPKRTRHITAGRAWRHSKCPGSEYKLRGGPPSQNLTVHPTSSVDTARCRLHQKPLGDFKSLDVQVPAPETQIELYQHVWRTP